MAAATAATAAGFCAICIAFPPCKGAVGGVGVEPLKLEPTNDEWEAEYCGWKEECDAFGGTFPVASRPVAAAEAAAAAAARAAPLRAPRDDVLPRLPPRGFEPRLEFDDVDAVGPLYPCIPENSGANEPFGVTI